MTGRVQTDIRRVQTKSLKNIILRAFLQLKSVNSSTRPALANTATLADLDSHDSSGPLTAKAHTDLARL